MQLLASADENSFEAYRRLRDDKTPTSEMLEGFYETMERHVAYTGAEPIGGEDAPGSRRRQPAALGFATTSGAAVGARRRRLCT